LISIVGGIVYLEYVKIRDISNGFSSIVSVSQTTSISATDISFLALKNAENLLNSVSSQAITLNTILIEDCYLINNYIDINLTPFKIDNLTINTTSWSQQRILTDLSPHVLYSALKIQLIDYFD